MKRLPLFTPTIVVLTIFVVAALLAQPQGAVIAIRGARVVDGTGAPAKLATVLIRGERIEAVGENLAIPAGARVIDAQGLTLIPGLFDLHTHLQSATVTGLSGDLGKNLKAYLAAGVTTVVNFSGSPETFEPIRRLVAEGVLPSPRLLLAARFSPPGGWITCSSLRKRRESTFSYAWIITGCSKSRPTTGAVTITGPRTHIT